jgi:F420-dependent oxidoreductase-like protein
VRAPINLDLHVANFNFADTTPDQLFERLVQIARTAENSGFTALSVMDHVHQIAMVGPPENWMLEGPSALAALAARTSTINLTLLVGGVTYRNPALLAKLTTTLDIISGGRAVLGIGAAWNQEEHDAYGFDFPSVSERFERLEEALKISRAMFTQAQSSVAGTHYATAGAYNNPQPLRGDIPILIGGSGERKTLRMVAQYADACNLFGDLERIKHLLGVLDQHCENVGRNPKDITRTQMASVFIAPTHEEALRKRAALRPGVPAEQLDANTLTGDPSEVAEQAQRYLDAGLDGFTIGLPDASDLETVELIGRTLGPLVS